jgi:hypothetical protein
VGRVGHHRSLSGKPCFERGAPKREIEAAREAGYVGSMLAHRRGKVPATFGAGTAIFTVEERREPSEFWELFRGCFSVFRLEDDKCGTDILFRSQARPPLGDRGLIASACPLTFKARQFQFY